MKKYSIAVSLFLIFGSLGYFVFGVNRKVEELQISAPKAVVISPVSSQKNDAPDIAQIADPKRGQVAASGKPIFGKSESEQERLGRYRAMLNRPELREMLVRRIAKDYRPLFDRLHLDDKKEALLSTIILDRMGSEGVGEWEAYEKLTAELLTASEYAEFTRYRDEELPQQSYAASAITALKRANGSAVVERESIVAALVQSSPTNGDPMWKTAERRQQAGELSTADLSVLATMASQRFEVALRQHAAMLPETEKQVLRDWFQKQVIDFKIDALKRQLALGGG